MCNKLYGELKQKFLPSTSLGYMTKAKALFTFAVDNGIMRINPCATIKVERGTPNISYLTTDDLNKIKSLDLADYPKLEKVKDLLLFQSSTGLAYADLIKFSADDVQVSNGVMVYSNNRQKTGIEFTTVILKDGVEVLQKYNGQLPMISCQKYNVYLKDIQKLAGISTTITTHLLRKTYATYLLNSGVNISAVSKALGHSNTTITQRCYAKTTNEFVVSEIAKIVH
jgi:site-specific recombinase XerD